MGISGGSRAHQAEERKKGEVVRETVHGIPDPGQSFHVEVLTTSLRGPLPFVLEKCYYADWLRAA
jgi:hypothetical protein